MARPDQSIVEERDGKVILTVHAQPGAGNTEVVGTYGSALKIRVAAPPTRNRANEALRELIAEVFDVKPKDVELIAGETNREKRFRLSGIELEDAERAVEALVWADPSRAERGLRPESRDRP